MKSISLHLSLALILSGGVAMGQADPLEGQDWNCRCAAQDDSGIIYASPPGDGRDYFVKWEQGRRSTTGSDFGPGAKLALLQRGPNGSVYALWDCDDHTVTICYPGLDHYSRQPRVQGPASRVQIFPDSKGNLWVTDAGLNIYRYTGGKRTLIHTIIGGEMNRAGDLAKCRPVSIMEDGRGRMWFWSDALMHGEPDGAIKGVLIWDGDAVTHHPVLTNAPDGEISVIYKVNPDALWLAARDAGVYSINLDTLEASPVMPPAPDAFRTVQKIFSNGDDLYVVAGGMAEMGSDGTTGALWRRRAGAWSNVINGIDMGWHPADVGNRDWLAAADGLWLGSYGLGGWFLPKEGAPRPIDWRVNSPLHQIDRWLQMGDGRIAALQFGQGGISIRPASLLAAPLADSGIKIMQMDRPMVGTGGGLIFHFLSRENSLGVWDGRQWQSHPLPKSFSWSDYETVADSFNRLWWIHLSYSTPDPTPGWIFDPAAGKFEKFESYQAALEAQLPRAAKFSLANDPYFAPKFSGDGRICFEDRYWKLYYYNGHKWKVWQKHEIGPLSKQTVSPFFDKHGILTIALDKGPWQFSDLDGWHLKPDAAAAPTPPGSAEASAPLPSLAFVPDSVVLDRLGTRWFTHDGQLYRAGFGLVSGWFKPGEPQPFVDGSRLQEVLIDKNGGAYVRTDTTGGKGYVYLPAAAPMPRAGLQTDDAPDGVVLRLSAPGFPDARYSWRIDGGPWSEAASNTLVSLDMVAKGIHHVQVLAIGDHLQTDGLPTEAVVEVRGDPAAQIQKWIAQLDDTEYSRREAAVAALVRVPDLARPALEKALKQKGSGDHWWLEAAVQAVEQAGQKNGRGPE